MSAQDPAPFRCYFCEVALRSFVEAETFRPDGKKKAFRVRCVDQVSCDARVAENRLASRASAEEVRDAAS